MIGRSGLLFLSATMALSSLACGVSPEADDFGGSETADGASYELMELEGDGFGDMTFQCDEFLLCFANVTISLDRETQERLIDSALEQAAEDELEGIGGYYTELAQVEIVRLDDFDSAYEVPFLDDLGATVTVVRYEGEEPSAHLALRYLNAEPRDEPSDRVVTTVRGHGSRRFAVNVYSQSPEPIALQLLAEWY